jgi:hypothetical protein
VRAAALAVVVGAVLLLTGYAYPTPRGTLIAGQHGDTSLTGRVKVNRTYYQWGDTAKEDAQIRADLAAGRVPWVSFKPPSCGLGCIIDGSQDAAIRQRGKRYRAYGAPVMATFFHEPIGDVPPRQFWAAFWHVNDVMGAGPRGGLNNTTVTPILNGYIYADWYNGSKGTVSEWVQPGANLRVFGFDNYGTAAELTRMFNDVDARMPADGHIAIGEFGRDQGAAEFARKLDVFRSRAPWLNVVCYFNSRIQEFGSDSSPLGPGLKELDAWKAFLAEFN